MMSARQTSGEEVLSESMEVSLNIINLFLPEKPE